MHLRSLLLLAAALIPTLAHGQVLVEQLPNQFTFVYADEGCSVCGPGEDQSLAENFVLASGADINQIVIWGVHDNSDPGDPNDFDVNVFEDQGGLPGAVLYQEFSMASSATPTGVLIGFGMEAEVEVTLTPSSPISLGSGTYWIEIYNDTSGVDGAWGWVTAFPDPAAGLDSYAFSTTAPAGTWFPDNYSSGGPNDSLSLRLVGDLPTGLGNSYCTGAPNSTGSGGVISAIGQQSLAANDLTLHVSDLPDQPGVFFYGTSPDSAPFGDGFRCVGFPVVRRNPPVPVSGGSASKAVDIPSAAIGIGPHYFQFWYRDPAAGASGFNLTNGLEILFIP